MAWVPKVGDVAPECHCASTAAGQRCAVQPRRTDGLPHSGAGKGASEIPGVATGEIDQSGTVDACSQVGIVGIRPIAHIDNDLFNPKAIGSFESECVPALQRPVTLGGRRGCQLHIPRRPPVEEPSFDVMHDR